jgi:hypothetical protein
MPTQACSRGSDTRPPPAVRICERERGAQGRERPSERNQSVIRAQSKRNQSVICHLRDMQ